MDALETLMRTLAPAETKAVDLLRFCLETYNTKDGTGLFTGPARYAVLQERAALAAVQARSLRQWWAILLRRLRWPIPPSATDETLLALLTDPDDAAVLRVLALDTASVLTLARYQHTTDRTARRAGRAPMATAADADAAGGLFA
ncbi:MAG TPA: hypothetical protein VFE48_25545 [Methylomirabilota bacterium]|nr:hypothetical protein [Methylomirabilota bacterium]